MIWCFSISRPEKNYRKWTWETSCILGGSCIKWVSRYLFAAQQSSYAFFSHLNVNVATAKTFVRIEIDSVSQVDWFSLPLNESLILNHTTIVTNSMPNPFSSFHISLWWCPKSVGVHKWQRWPWFISGRRASRGQLTSRYISCFLTWNNKTRSKTSNW